MSLIYYTYSSLCTRTIGLCQPQAVNVEEAWDSDVKFVCFGNIHTVTHCLLLQFYLGCYIRSDKSWVLRK